MDQQPEQDRIWSDRQEEQDLERVNVVAYALGLNPEYATIEAAVQGIMGALIERNQERAEDGAKLRKYKRALEDIVDPLAAFRRDLEAGSQLNGEMAVRLSESATHLKQVAKKALEAA